jgi:hypothetical protein
VLSLEKTVQRLRVNLKEGNDERKSLKAEMEEVQKQLASALKGIKTKDVVISKKDKELKVRSCWVVGMCLGFLVSNTGTNTGTDTDLWLPASLFQVWLPMCSVSARPGPCRPHGLCTVQVFVVAA